MGDQNGVTIGLREIYDKVQEVVFGVQRLTDRINVLEEKVKETDEVDVRSSEALRIAKEAAKDAAEVKKIITWFWKSIIGALIVSAFGALFYFKR